MKLTRWLGMGLGLGVLGGFVGALLKTSESMQPVPVTPGRRVYPPATPLTWGPRPERILTAPARKA
jgi:hypothetical protein